MKRVFVVFAVLLVLFPLFSQSGSEKTQSADVEELVVFAASSLTESLSSIKAMYESANPNIRIIYNLDSSGTLKTQVENGAECDVFLSASPKQMDALVAQGLADDLTRVDLLSNAVVLAVPAKNPKGLRGFDHMAQLLREGSVLMAIGNADVPVGQYTKKIFDYYGIEETAVSRCLSYGSNAKEVTTQVRAASVDCAIVYATDAKSAGLEIVEEATQNMCGFVVYPAAVMIHSKRADAAKAFLDYLKSEEAMAVFQSVGFTTM